MTEFRAQGDMPRGQQFGYVFGAGVKDWGWLLAHELGHGVFTLRHLDDGNYGAKDTLGSVSNLMNYTRSTELQAFQWNIMSNPAILTAFDSDDASKGLYENSKILFVEVAQFLKLIPKYNGVESFENKKIENAGFEVSSYNTAEGKIVGYGVVRKSDKRIIYILIGAETIKDFSEGIAVYSVAASLFYVNGTPSPGIIEMMAGSYYKGLGLLWKEALTTPEYYEYLLGITSGVVLNLPRKNIYIHKTISHTPSFISSSKFSQITDLTSRLSKIPNLQVKNIRYGTGDIVIISRDMGLARKTALELKSHGFNVEILDDAYLNGRRYNIEGKQWTVNDAMKDMKDVNTHKMWRDVNKNIKPEYIESIPMGKLNKMWIEYVKNNDYTVIDLGNPLNRDFSMFYDMELNIMNWK